MGVPKDQARVLFAESNFWGRTLAAVSSSTDPSAYGGYGPMIPGFETIPYDDLSVGERCSGQERRGIHGRTDSR